VLKRGDRPVPREHPVMPAGQLAGVQRDRGHLALIDADLDAAADQPRVQLVVVGVDPRRSAGRSAARPRRRRDAAPAALGEVARGRRLQSVCLGDRSSDIAEFMRNLPHNERQTLAVLSRTVAEQPGTATQALLSNSRLIIGAQKVGLIDRWVRIPMGLLFALKPCPCGSFAFSISERCRGLVVVPNAWALIDLPDGRSIEGRGNVSRHGHHGGSMR
jgi:hypothetical protein